jgi:hypothetical protein
MGNPFVPLDPHSTDLEGGNFRRLFRSDWWVAALCGKLTLGVGAVFYTEVALEVLPHDGHRQHLRE